MDGGGARRRAGRRAEPPLGRAAVASSSGRSSVTSPCDGHAQQERSTGSPSTGRAASTTRGARAARHPGDDRRPHPRRPRRGGDRRRVVERARHQAEILSHGVRAERARRSTAGDTPGSRLGEAASGRAVSKLERAFKALCARARHRRAGAQRAGRRARGRLRVARAARRSSRPTAGSSTAAATRSRTTGRATPPRARRVAGPAVQLPPGHGAAARGRRRPSSRR